jgi:hypothetical protein
VRIWGRDGRRVLLVSACGILTAIALGAGACETVPQTPTTTMAGGATSNPAEAPAPARSAAGAFTTTISVNTSGKVLGAITSHYVGLSFESGTLNGGHFDARGNLPQLMRNLGSSVMRFGGLTVDDETFPGITPRSLAGLARLARASGWTVLYSEDLAHYDAAAVTADAQAVAAALGPSLSAMACGNEPDGYSTHGWRSPAYTVGSYLKDAAACLAAIRAGAPAAPLEGADLTGAPQWLASYVKQESGKVAWLGQHLYQAGCRQDYAGQTALQADAKLLSPSLTAREVSNFKWLVADAKIAKARPIMSETNSICSGGLAGVSDSFAAALWVIDYMLTGAENGVYGMNIHDRFTANCTPYSPLCPKIDRPDEYTAQPIYYGMLFTHLLGTGHLLPVTVRSGGRNVTAFALRPVTGGLRFMVEDLTPASTKVTLSAGRAARFMAVQYLTAPSLTATAGVTIQGAAVGPDGTIGPGAPTVLTCSGGCRLTLPPYTAALVTLNG